MEKKRVTSTFRLSEAASRLLKELATRCGTSKTAVLETLIRKEAKKQGVRDGQIPDDRERDA